MEGVKNGWQTTIKLQKSKSWFLVSFSGVGGLHWAVTPPSPPQGGLYFLLKQKNIAFNLL
jgi:hypothetical protein